MIWSRPPPGVRGTDSPTEDERTDRGLFVLPEIRPGTTPARLADSAPRTSPARALTAGPTSAAAARAGA